MHLGQVGGDVRTGVAGDAALLPDTVQQLGELFARLEKIALLNERQADGRVEIGSHAHVPHPVELLPVVVDQIACGFVAAVADVTHGPRQRDHQQQEPIMRRRRIDVGRQQVRHARGVVGFEMIERALQRQLEHDGRLGGLRVRLDQPDGVVEVAEPAADELRPGRRQHELEPGVAQRTRKLIDPAQELREVRAADHRPRRALDEGDQGRVVAGELRVANGFRKKPALGEPARWPAD